MKILAVVVLTVFAAIGMSNVVYFVLTTIGKHYAIQCVQDEDYSAESPITIGRKS